MCVSVIYHNNTVIVCTYITLYKIFALYLKTQVRARTQFAGTHRHSSRCLANAERDLFMYVVTNSVPLLEIQVQCMLY